LQHPLGLVRWNDKLLIADTYNHRIKLLDPGRRSVNAFAGSGKPGQTDGAHPSFYEPGGLSIANGKLYVADTNNHAIRVVDLKTKETKTLQLSGLQPPTVNQSATNGDVAPNAEEIELPAQKIRAGESAAIINIDLPAGYHLNPNAPQRYSLSIGSGGESLGTGPVNVNKSGKGLALPIRVPFDVGDKTAGGNYSLRASFTFVYCREDNTGVCRIKTVRWHGPLEVVNDQNASSEVRLNAKATGD
jgi:hypothetical protein